MLVCEADWRESSGLRHRGGLHPPRLVGWVPRPAFDAALGSGPLPALAGPGGDSVREPRPPGCHCEPEGRSNFPVGTERLRDRVRRCFCVDRGSRCSYVSRVGNFCWRGLTSRARRPFMNRIWATYRPLGLGIGRREAWSATGLSFHMSSAHRGRVPPVRTCRSSSRLTSYAYSHRFTCVTRSIARCAS